jgi:hypothetical protein
MMEIKMRAMGATWLVSLRSVVTGESIVVKRVMTAMQKQATAVMTYVESKPVGTVA